MALGLQSLWQMDDISFVLDESKSKELHIHIGFPSGTRFPDETGVLCSVHDKVEREWQHSKGITVTMSANVKSR